MKPCTAGSCSATTNYVKPSQRSNADAGSDTGSYVGSNLSAHNSDLHERAMTLSSITLHELYFDDLGGDGVEPTNV